MELLRTRAIELCGLSALTISVVFVAALLGAEMRALGTLIVVVALTAFIIANTRSTNVAVGAAVGGIVFAAYWVGWYIFRSYASGEISPGWLVDLVLGVMFVGGLVYLSKLAQHPPTAEAATTSA